MSRQNRHMSSLNLRNGQNMMLTRFLFRKRLLKGENLVGSSLFAEKLRNQSETEVAGSIFRDMRLHKYHMASCFSVIFI